MLYQLAVSSARAPSLSLGHLMVIYFRSGLTESGYENKSVGTNYNQYFWCTKVYFRLARTMLVFLMRTFKISYTLNCC